MAKRVVLRIYEEDCFSGKKELKHSDVIVTELTASEIVDFLQVSDGFGARIVEGNVLSFLDFSCIVVPVDEIVARLKELPVSEEEPEADIPNKCILFVAEQHNEEPLVRSERELVYVCNRFECGASSLGELIIEAAAWASGHPIAMIFIGGFLWDRVKDLWDMIRRRLGAAVQTAEGPAPIAFSPKKFHKNLSHLLNLGINDFQIIKISRVKRGEHRIVVRTIKNEVYEVVANTYGKIVAVKPKP